MTPERIEVFGIRLKGEVQPGVDLPRLVASALHAHGLVLREGDVVVIAQKVVSKAEGRLVQVDQIEPSPFAVEIANTYGKDARVVELVLGESRRIVKMDRGVMIVETRHGFVCANAGVDLSNVSGGTVACLLPEDSDRSAAALRDGLRRLTGMAPAVIVSDTFGRPWRAGLANVALGVVGLAPIRSHVGEADSFGYALRMTEMAVADELASAAELVMGKTDGRPVALIRGYTGPSTSGSGRDLIRDSASDLFR